MHIVKDENGNICAHEHMHEHTHTHTYEHSHEHGHKHGEEDDHNHSHENGPHCHGHGPESGHCHVHEDGPHCHGSEGGHCPGHGPEGGHCHAHDQGAAPGDKNAAVLKYMLDHNTHHAAELDQMADKLAADGHEKAAEQIRKAVDEFQKGNLYLNLALSLVNDNGGE